MEVLNMADNLVPSMLPVIGNSRPIGGSVSGSDNGFNERLFNSPRDESDPSTNLPQLVNIRNTTSFPNKSPRHAKGGGQLTGQTPKIKSKFEDDRPAIFNPEPLPYQPQIFKSSTAIKKVSVPTRHQDTFSGKETTSPRQVPVIMHTERYQWDDPSNRNPITPSIPMLMHALQNPHITYSRSVYNYNKQRPLTYSDEKLQFRVNQRDRHRAEINYMERLRGMKRKREVLPHRAPHDLLLGGERAEFTERTSIQDELCRLKSIILPDNARELYHGKGIHLPEQHASVKPRRPPLPDPPTEIKRQTTQLSESSPQQLPTVGRSKTFITTSQNVSKSQRTISSSHTLPPIRQTEFEKLGPPSKSSKDIRVRGVKPGITPRVRVHSGASESEAGLDTDKSWNKDVDMQNISNTGQEAEHARRELESEMEIHLPSEDQPANIAQLPPGPPKTAGTLPKDSSPVKAVTPNPLKGTNIITVLSESEKSELQQMFERLDTDSDGHLTYPQLKSKLPNDFSAAQEKFIKQVYDITSSSTFFGVNEFITVTHLASEVNQLSGAPEDAYEKLNFSALNESIIQYVELFESVDRFHGGKISVESLEEILCMALEKDKLAHQEFLNDIKQVLQINNGDTITKINYLAHIPYFMTLE